MGLHGTVEWPNGARCAVALAWDIDFDTTLHLEHPERGYTEYELLSDLKYEEVGLPNVLEAIGELGLHQTFFISSWNTDRYPDLSRQIVSGSHELACHGVMHEAPNQQSDDRERALLLRSRQTLQAFTGTGVLGFRAPYAAFSHRTARLLAEQSFAYDSSLMNDHNPYLICTPARVLVELPIDIAMSDAPHFAHIPSSGYLMQPQRADQAIAYYRAVIEAAAEINGFTTTIWHPAISGRPERLLPIARYLRELRDRQDVWLAPMQEVAAWVQAWAADHPGQLREVALPFYPQPVELP